MTTYAYDTEFLEDGKRIGLISIGIVAEDGREYYAVNSDAPWDRIKCHDWLVRNVLPSLPLEIDGDLEEYRAYQPGIHPRPTLDFVSPDRSDTRVKPHWVIANEVRDFLLAGDTLPELWADYAAYDHVALCQLWGRMVDLPEGLPMFTHDLQQMISVHSYVPVEQEVGQHNALEDARHVMRVLRKWRRVR